MSRRATLPTLLSAALCGPLGGCLGPFTRAEDPAPRAISRLPYPTVVRDPAPTGIATRPPEQPAGTSEHRPVLYERGNPPVLPPLPSTGPRTDNPVDAIPPGKPEELKPDEVVAPPPAPVPTAPPEPVGPPAPPKPADPPLVQILRAYIDKHPDEAFALLKDFDKANQDLLMCLVPLVVRLSEGSLRQADPNEMAVLVEQLQSVLGSLRTYATLRIEKLFFCRQEAVNYFCQLDPRHPFRSSGDIALLYVAPRNFSCLPVQDTRVTRGDLSETPRYRTGLEYTVELHSAEGQPFIWKTTLMPPESRKPPEKFYEVLTLILPPMPPGHYRLVLKLLDRPTNRTAQQALDFVVADDPADGLRSAR
jgi:hypothetical protein